MQPDHTRHLELKTRFAPYGYGDVAPCLPGMPFHIER
jgi:hypothetical protein